MSKVFLAHLIGGLSILCAQAALSAAPTSSGMKTILVLGDSLSAAYGIYQNTAVYPGIEGFWSDLSAAYLARGQTGDAERGAASARRAIDGGRLMLWRTLRCDSATPRAKSAAETPSPPSSLDIAGAARSAPPRVSAATRGTRILQTDPGSLRQSDREP